MFFLETLSFPQQLAQKSIKLVKLPGRSDPATVQRDVSPTTRGVDLVENSRAAAPDIYCTCVPIAGLYFGARSLGAQEVPALAGIRGARPVA